MLDTVGAVSLMMNKATDKLLMVGRRSEPKAVVYLIRKRLLMNKEVKDHEIKFNVCAIRREDNGYVSMSMTNYVKSIVYMEIKTKHRTQKDEIMTAK